MNERYTYGYNNGFNVENPYIDSLNEVIEDYNNQVKKIEEINNSLENAERDIDASIKEQIEEANSFIQRSQEEITRNNNVTYPTFNDEQIRQWYNEDYPSYNTTITFESYKTSILRELEISNNINKQNLAKRNEDLSEQIKQKQEYSAKLNLEKKDILEKVVSQKKDEYKANIRYLIDIKNESKKSIFRKKNEINLLLSEKRIQLSSILLEQQRTTPKYDENGNVLNSEELIALRNKYDNVWLEIRKIEHALQKTEEMLSLMEYTRVEIDLMMRGLNPKQKELYNNIIDTKIRMDSQDQIQEIKEEKSGATETKNMENNNPIDTTHGVESNLIEPERALSFEDLIRKICRGTSFTKSESSRYAASKIKVFNKPQLNNLGLIGKITSIGKSVIGILPKAAMKLYGKSIDPITEGMFQSMEKRVMELSDAEVDIIINEYNDKLDVIPEGFEQILKPRINLYVSKRVEYLRKQFNDTMFQIALTQKAIEEYEDDKTVNAAYFTGYLGIKGLIKNEIEVEKLLKVSNIHSFGSQLSVLKTKLTYAGARFETAKEYDSSLWSKVSGLSQKIEYSLDPKEVVDSYTEREKIYKEYGKHKSYLTEADLEKLNNNSKKEEKVEKVDPIFKKSDEIRSLIEGLKTMKAELTEQDVKEIEGLLR